MTTSFRYIFIVSALLLGFSSCKKDEDPPFIEKPDEIEISYRTIPGSIKTEGESCIQDADGDFYTGSVSGHNEGVLLRKWDPYGNVLWETDIKISPGLRFKSMAQDAEENLYFTGYGSTNLVVIKTDNKGRLIWLKTEEVFEGNKKLFLYPQHISCTSDGGVLIGGTHSVDSPRLYLTKLDGKGNVMWQNADTTNTSQVVNKIREVSDGNYIVVGATYVESFGYAGTISKYDSNGIMLWNFVRGLNVFNEILDFIELPGGDIIVVGEYDWWGSEKAFISRYKTSGHLVWQQGYHPRDRQSFQSLTYNEDGTLTVVGYQVQLNNGLNSTNVLMVDITTDGDIIEGYRFGEENVSEQGLFIFPKEDGHIVFGAAGDRDILFKEVNK